MGPIRARVKDGKLVVDEPTLLPEGTVLDLVIVTRATISKEGAKPCMRRSTRR
jgi:hypothetical protein